MFIITNSITNNFQLLNYIATKSCGKFLNSKKLKIEEIVEQIEKPFLQFLCSDYEEEIEEVYPNEPIVLNNNTSFNIFGKISEKIKDLKKSFKIGLSFYFGKEIITKEFEITLNNNEKKIDNKIIEYLWVNEKINSMLNFPELNKKEIQEIGKKFFKKKKKKNN
jgi:Ca-activated chloride channel homolog